MEIAAGLSPFFSFLVKNVKYIILALIFVETLLENVSHPLFANSCAVHQEDILYDLRACILVKR